MTTKDSVILATKISTKGLKLWIDDIRTPPDDSWHICRDVSSAIRALDMFWEQVREINLDHDISHQVVINAMSRPYPCTETFEAVARYIATLKHAHSEWSPFIQIHTSNYAGASSMQKILLDAKLHANAKVIGGANRLETIL